MNNVGFTFSEGLRRFLYATLAVVLFIILWLAVSAVAGRYMYSTRQPVNHYYNSPGFIDHRL